MTKSQMLKTTRSDGHAGLAVSRDTPAGLFWPFQNLNFGSCFGFRVSDFGFCLGTPHFDFLTQS
jgi:hypothetical protein